MSKTTKFFDEFHHLGMGLEEPAASDPKNPRFSLQFYVGVWWFLQEEKQTILYSHDRDLLIEYVAIGDGAPWSWDRKFRYDTIFDEPEVDALHYPRRAGMDCVIARQGEDDFCVFQISLEIMPEEVEHWKQKWQSEHS